MNEKDKWYVVCYNEYRCIGWRTEKEFQELFRSGEINWYIDKQDDSFNKIENKKRNGGERNE